MILKSQKFVYEHQEKINDSENKTFIEEIIADSIEDALTIGKMMFPRSELIMLKRV